MMLSRKKISERKRVALFLPSLEGGGAERAFVDLANQFAARGVDVDFVLARTEGPYIHELDTDRVRVVNFAASRWIYALFKLVRYLRRERPDAMLSGLDTTNVIAVVASVFARVDTRVVISQRAVLRPVWQLEHPGSWRFWLWVMKQALTRAQFVLCNSTAAANEVINDFGVDPGKCVVILNGIDTAGIARQASERIDDPWLAPSAPPLLLSVGRLMLQKDMPTVLRAFAIVRKTCDCNLVILGEGVERPALEALIRELGIENCVRLEGFVTNPFPWIAAADVLVSASVAEGCPNVIQQALALGTAIVATDCPGGTAEVLEDGRWGRLVPIRDPEAMAEAIIATLKDEAKPDGRTRAQSFDRDRTVDRYLELLLPGDAVSLRGAQYVAIEPSTTVGS
jgi:glycosyltransferase involved in cell wall biosynthesis